MSQGFEEGTLGCSESCELDVEESCSSCGDGVVSGDEVCDGVADATCESLGFLGGNLRCASDCSAFQTGSCVDGAVGEPCVDGNCAENAFCLEQAMAGGCVARCASDVDCEDGEDCQAVEGESASVCAPSGDQNGISICTPDCLSNGCFSCPAPNTCENISEFLGAFFGNVLPFDDDVGIVLNHTKYGMNLTD
ncbi:MAG: hypothetical protein GY822_12465 [Deltaproteobacteria bacterium]|nr:hypothetical protein [Deltaproteobacteria bacterium]